MVVHKVTIVTDCKTKGELRLMFCIYKRTSGAVVAWFTCYASAKQSLDRMVTAHKYEIDFIPEHADA